MRLLPVHFSQCAKRLRQPGNEAIETFDYCVRLLREERTRNPPFTFSSVLTFLLSFWIPWEIATFADRYTPLVAAERKLRELLSTKPPTIVKKPIINIVGGTGRIGLTVPFTYRYVWHTP